MSLPSEQGGTPSTFWKKVASLATGAVFSQAVNVAILPVLSRLYLPDEFGVFGVFLAVVAVFAVSANMGYEMAIMLPDKREDAHGLMKLSLQACVGISVALLILLVAIPESWIRWAGQEAVIGWHYLIPLSVFLEGVIQAVSVSLNRSQLYQEMTRLRIARAVTNALIAVGAGLAGAGVEGLLIGFMLGQGINAIGGWWLWKRQSAGIRFEGTLRELARSYRDFPLYGMASAWLNVASKQVIFFLMPGLFGEGATGQYSKSERVLNIAPGLMSISIGRVFYEEASTAARQGTSALAKITSKTAIRLAVLGLPVLVILILWGPDLFAWVLGSQWRQAGEFARWMSPWLYLTMIASPLSYLIDIRRKLKEFLLYNASLFMVRTGVLIWAGQQFGALKTVAWFGAAGAVMMLIQIGYLLNLGGVFSNRKTS